MKLNTLTGAGLIGATVLAGTLVFNSGAAENALNNIEVLRTKIAQFAQNDDALVSKYNTLKDDAEKKIASLQKEISDLNAQLDKEDTSTSDKTELEAEIQRLTGELEKANTAIANLEEKSTAAVEEANNYKMTDPDTLPGLGEEEGEEVVDFASAKANFSVNKTQVTITLKKDINLALTGKGDVSIKFTDKDGKSLSKSKIYAGFLNDSQGNKYGKGTNIPSNEYSNELVAGNTYTTTLSENNKPSLTQIDATNIVKVEVTVTDNNGVKHVLEPIVK